MQCPTREELIDCLLGKVAPARADTLLDHAETCEVCHGIVDAVDSHSDAFTSALSQNGDSQIAHTVPNECERMIDRAEIYIQSELPTGDVAAEPPKQHLLQGTKVRDYEIIRPIGEGGMGAVFLARHSRLNRDVALKVLSLRRSGDREAQRRFEQEMTIVGKLQHPGIVRALDAGEHNGVQYLVMELVDGADLRQIVDVLGPIPLAEACEICRRAAEALNYAHEQNLIHRDVKPSNIMLQKDGSVKLMDLGLARFTDQHRSLTSTQQAMGSLDFMAPEQLRAEDVDRRADIYGLACTLHFLLLGEPPERRRTAALMVSRTPKLEALKSILPPPVTRLLLQMLAADPAKRCESLTDVVEQLAPFCNRSDLVQLAAKAHKSVPDISHEGKDSITSEVELERVPSSAISGKLRVLAGCLATLLLGVLLYQTINPAAGLLSTGNKSTSNHISASALAAMNCVSSNIEPTKEIPLFQVHDDSITQVTYHEPTSQLICGSSDASVSIRDLPNQSRVISVCLFDSPLKQIEIVPGQNKIICLDESGNLACIQLPKGNTNWVTTTEDHGSAPSNFKQRGTYVELSHNDKTAYVSIADGSTYQPSEEVPRPAESEIGKQPPHAAEQNRSASDLTDLITLGSDLPSAACYVESNIVRYFDETKLREQDAYEHFVYAEHTSPITCLCKLPEENLIFTGDQAGEIRLWHLPDQRPSYMLLSCVNKLDSIELSFLHRQQRWSRREFSNSPEDVKFDNLLGEMRIESEIERNGMRHVLEYRVKPKAAK